MLTMRQIETMTIRVVVMIVARSLLPAAGNGRNLRCLKMMRSVECATDWIGRHCWTSGWCSSVEHRRVLDCPCTRSLDDHRCRIGSVFEWSYIVRVADAILHKESLYHWKSHICAGNGNLAARRRGCEPITLRTRWIWTVRVIGREHIVYLAEIQLLLIVAFTVHGIVWCTCQQEDWFKIKSL